MTPTFADRYICSFFYRVRKVSSDETSTFVILNAVKNPFKIPRFHLGMTQPKVSSVASILEGGGFDEVEDGGSVHYSL